MLEILAERVVYEARYEKRGEPLMTRVSTLSCLKWSGPLRAAQSTGNPRIQQGGNVRCLRFFRFSRFWSPIVPPTLHFFSTPPFFFLSGEKHREVRKLQSVATRVSHVCLSWIVRSSAGLTWSESQRRRGW